MILSVSRRTDIPGYYSDWFFQRIKEGFVYVRNPMNARQISEIALSPENIDCIVFWTKNPEPMLHRLQELAAYHYYFQFTLTGYGPDIECNLPDKNDKIIPVFQKLSEKTGREKVLWRYDPILFNDRYTREYHLSVFSQIAEALNGYTEKCIISFVDRYAKNQKNLQQIGLSYLQEDELLQFAGQLHRIASDNKMTIAACAEEINLQECGIQKNACIDKELIERITGRELKIQKDRNQRTACGCVSSIDIGTYNTCKNGCKYCYANYSEKSVARNCERYHVMSPLLCGELREGDQVRRRG